MSSDAEFHLPEGYRQFMDALGTIATDTEHPRWITAVHLFALLLGKMERSEFDADGFRHSAELTSLLAALAERMGPPATTESLRQWAADWIEVVPRSPVVLPDVERPN